MPQPITPFCRAVPGRAACSTCAGRLATGQQPERRDARHEPWPFEPCPHYVRGPATREVRDAA